MIAHEARCEAWLGYLNRRPLAFLHLRSIVPTMSLNSKKYIQLSALSCQGLSVTSHSTFRRLSKYTGNNTFYLFVTIDYQLQWTLAVKKSKNPKWEDNLYFDTTILENEKMNIQVFAKHHVGEDEMVGELKELVNVSELFGDENSEIKMSLFSGRSHRVD